VINFVAKILVIAICLPFLTVCPPSWAVDSEVYRMGPGDILEVVVWKEDRLSRNDILVRPDGRISLPMVDDIIAAGLTPMELKETIAKSAGRYVQRPMVYVIVREPRSHSYSVIGNVRSPGRFPLEQPTTVLQGIAEAEGFNEWAHKDDVVILRGNGQQQTRINFSYSDVLSGKGLDQNVILKPGDTIIVP
jgi:polysaccharide export outer membrane protein